MINVSKIFQPLPYKVFMMICNEDDDDLQQYISYDEVHVYCLSHFCLFRAERRRREARRLQGLAGRRQAFAL